MEPRKRGLGRGLGALLPGARDEAPATTAPALLVDVASIRPNPFQPRQVFSEESLAELVSSIRERGVLQPMLVRRVDNGWQLIAGERRLRAAQRAGLQQVPVVVREADDRTMLELALVENLQREDLNPIEEARSYRRLMDDFELTQEDVARQVGKSRSAVANSVRLLKLPADVQERVARGELSAGHARGLLALGSSDQQVAAARHVVGGKLSVRDTERLARERTARRPDIDRAAAEEALSRALGTRVRLQERKGGAGRIEIEYYSLAELNGLIDRLTREPTGDDTY